MTSHLDTWRFGHLPALAGIKPIKISHAYKSASLRRSHVEHIVQSQTNHRQQIITYHIRPATHVVCNFYMVAYCSSAGLGLLMIGKTTDKSMNSVPTSSRCICFQVSVLKFVCVRVINFWLAMPAACTVLLLKIAFSANRLVSIV